MVQGSASVGGGAEEGGRGVGVGLERRGARWGPSEKRRPQLLVFFFWRIFVES